MTLAVNGREDTCDLDDLFAWAYKENVFGLLFRGHNTQNCVMLRFSSDNCAELVRKLTEILQESS